MSARNDKHQRGAVDIIVLIGLAILTVALPAAKSLVSQKQETRSRAAEACSLSQANTWRCNGSNREQCQCWSGACGWGNSQPCPHGCTNGSCNSPPAPPPTPTPACTLGEKICVGQIAKECKWYGGYGGGYYWDEKTCQYGCKDGICNPVPASPTPMPTATVTPRPLPTSTPTPIPTTPPPGCVNPTGSLGDKWCMGNVTKECKWESRYGVGYYWYEATCQYGCAGGSCNSPPATPTPTVPAAIATATPSPTPTLTCTSAGQYQEDRVCYICYYSGANPQQIPCAPTATPTPTSSFILTPTPTTPFSIQANLETTQSIIQTTTSTSDASTLIYDIDKANMPIGTQADEENFYKLTGGALIGSLVAPAALAGAGGSALAVGVRGASYLLATGLAGQVGTGLYKNLTGDESTIINAVDDLSRSTGNIGAAAGSVVSGLYYGSQIADAVLQNQAVQDAADRLIGSTQYTGMYNPEDAIEANQLLAKDGFNNQVVKAIASYEQLDRKAMSSVENFDKYYDESKEAGNIALNLILEKFPDEKASYNSLKTALESASVEDLVQTQAILRNKYDLPIKPLVVPDYTQSDYSPLEYSRELGDLANQYGVPIRPVSEYERFFKANPGARALSSGGAVYIRSDPETPFYAARDLEHELTHAIQAIRFPRIPIAQQEFEAYLVGTRRTEYGFNIEGTMLNLSTSVLIDLKLKLGEIPLMIGE